MVDSINSMSQTQTKKAESPEPKDVPGVKKEIINARPAEFGVVSIRVPLSSMEVKNDEYRP